MKITKSLKLKLEKIRSQKKGIKTFLLKEGYSQKFADQIKEKFQDLIVK